MLKYVPDGDWLCPKCPNTEAEVSVAEMGQSLVDKLGKMELNIKEELGVGAKLLGADVGPRRVVKKGASQPWQASSTQQLAE